MTPALYNRISMLCSNAKRAKTNQRQQEVYLKASAEIREGCNGLISCEQDQADAQLMLNAYCWAELAFAWRPVDRELKEMTA